MNDYKLQKAPSGLLGAFGLKIEGHNPDQFGGMIAPVVDVRDMYMLDLQQGSSSSANVTVAGDSVTLTVPDGEFWNVRHIAAFLIIGAATDALDGVRFSIGVNAVGVAEVNNPPLGAAFAATTVIHASAFLGAGLLLRPGDQCTFTNGATLTVASSATIRARFERIPA